MFGLVPFGSKKNNEVARREDGFHSLFDIFNEPFFTNPFAGFGDMGMPASMRVDVKDNGSSYELTADLPGMEKKDISLSYDNNYLTIEATTSAASVTPAPSAVPSTSTTSMRLASLPSSTQAS